MTRPLHPYEAIHFQPTGRVIPVRTCRTLAIVVSDDPAKVTCERCVAALGRLAQVFFFPQGAAMDISPKARAFLDDLIALCQRHAIKLEVDTMYDCVTLTDLLPGEAPLDEDFWEEAF